MLKKLVVLGLVLLTSGCSTFGPDEPVDYSDKSVIFGWLDLSDVDGNHMYDGTIKQYKPPTDKPYYHIGTEKYKGGFVYFFYALPNGSYKLNDVKLQSCILLFCSNTRYKYSFGAQGDVATAVIKKPGTYYMGSYKFTEVETGLFEPGKFNVEPAKNSPSKKELLQVVLKYADEHPAIVKQRIKDSLRKM